MEAMVTGEVCAPPATGASGFLRFFQDLPDPRGCNKIHKLHDLIVVAVMAVICGADGWVDVELFGKSKHGVVRDVPGLARRHPQPRHVRPGVRACWTPMRSSGASWRGWRRWWSWPAAG